MAEHELKIWPQFFEAVKCGDKTFEYRKNDRAFQKGDTVTLKEWDPGEVEYNEEAPGGMVLGSYKKPRGYTYKELEFKIGYVLPINAEYVVFSLIPLDAQAGGG